MKSIEIGEPEVVEAGVTPSLPPVIPSTYRQSVLSLRRMYNWDGRGAKAVKASACRAALAFIEAALERQPDLPLPRPAPSVLGAASLQWSRDDQDLVIRFFSDDPGKVASHWEGPGGRYENTVEHRDAAMARVLAFQPK